MEKSIDKTEGKMKFHAITLDTLKNTHRRFKVDDLKSKVGGLNQTNSTTKTEGQ